MFDNCVILAGGAGTRLWPASNSKLPKQFLPADNDKSFFLLAVKRSLKVINKNGSVIIITGKQHIKHIINDTDKLKASEKKHLIVICEPAARNTCAAIASVVIFSLLNGCNNNMLVLTSDHLINPIEIFRNDAANAAAVKDRLAVFGIKPNRPETGYGYIEAGKARGNVLEVTAFHEKPDIQTAKKYIKTKRFFWNSGMFAFNTGFIIDEFRFHCPEVIRPLEKLKAPKPENFKVVNGVKILDKWSGLEAAYKKIKSISFDYAIAEKCRKTVMIKAGFNWIDIGNWEEYVKIRGKENHQVFEVSSESCYVSSDIPVALAGVEDLIIVIRSGKNGDTASALITKKGQTQKVKDITELIKNSGRTELL